MQPAWLLARSVGTLIAAWEAHLESHVCFEKPLRLDETGSMTAPGNLTFIFVVLAIVAK